MTRFNIILASALLCAMVFAIPVISTADETVKVRVTDERLAEFVSASDELAKINSRVSEINDLELATEKEVRANWPKPAASPDLTPSSQKALLEIEIKQYIAGLLVDEINEKAELQRRRSDILKAYPELKITVTDKEGNKGQLYTFLAGSIKKEQKRELCNSAIVILNKETIIYTNLPADRNIPGYGRPRE